MWLTTAKDAFASACQINSQLTSTPEGEAVALEPPASCSGCADIPLVFIGASRSAVLGSHAPAAQITPRATAITRDQSLPPLWSAWHEPSVTEISRVGLIVLATAGSRVHNGGLLPADPLRVEEQRTAAHSIVKHNPRKRAVHGESGDDRAVRGWTA